MFFENIKLAFKNFTANKLRTLLSILGIVIGVASVITITTLGASATASIHSQISEAGLETISIFPGRNSSEIKRLFTVELGEQIEEQIDGVEKVVPINQISALLKYSYNTYNNARILAVDPAYSEIFNYEIQDGNFISDYDNSKRKSVVVLGSEIAEVLFPDSSAVGKYIKLYRNKMTRSFKVIGVMKTHSPTIGVNFDTSVYLPYNTFTQRIAKIETVGYYAIGTKEGMDVLEISEDINDFLLNLTGSSEYFKVISPSTIAEMSATVTNTLNLLLAGIAAISLLVGGIGIMNIMLVSVSERTKEIGIRKALGASPTVIRSQFLVEAVCLTLSGGILGMLFGTIFSYIGISILEWSFAPSLTAYIIAVAFSGSIGVFFGWYPAVRASGLDPVAALTFE